MARPFTRPLLDIKRRINFLRLPLYISHNISLGMIIYCFYIIRSRMIVFLTYLMFFTSTIEGSKFEIFIYLSNGPLSSTGRRQKKVVVLA